MFFTTKILREQNGGDRMLTRMLCRSLLVVMPLIVFLPQAACKQLESSDARQPYRYTNVLHLPDLTPDLERFDETYRIPDMDHGLRWSVYHERLFDSLAFEQEYDQIEVTLEESVFPVDFKEIPITVKNHRSQTAFYVWMMPMIEKKVGDSWKRIPETESMSLPRYWHIVGIDERPITPTPDNEEEFSVDYPMSGTVTVTLYRYMGTNPKHSTYYYPEFEPGEYRICIFAGKERFYVPLTLVTTTEANE